MNYYFIVLGVICLQTKWIYGIPVGVSSFSYQDSSGNRYGGTYQIPDGQFGHFFAPNDLPFQIPFEQNNYLPQGNFFPDYFRNFEYLIQEAFRSNFANQNLALKAARKAFDLTSHQAGYIPYFPFRSGDFEDSQMFNSHNSAFAGAAAGPGYTHQIAAINPGNPNQPNVNVLERFDDQPSIPGSNFVSMSSKSYAMSSNINGKETSNRGSETVVNNNGKITEYSVHS
ncbi:uncharacterized protein LOC106133521 [Amyelois transitella]|uniref:uncharacterized protein LOC106133521 n=1 Tax=Amyelois transitella TaxID=680683 RepID=UPI00067C5C23|nr:uncharacterized protein LOC106133521 [Amyelois transitella]